MHGKIPTLSSPKGWDKIIQDLTANSINYMYVGTCIEQYFKLPTNKEDFDVKTESNVSLSFPRGTKDSYII